jgi:hypothetical protein
MNQALKEGLKRGAKVLGYIVVSVVITVGASEVFNEWLELQINDAAIYTIVNVALAAAIKSLQEVFPNNRFLKLG